MNNNMRNGDVDGGGHSRGCGLTRAAGALLLALALLGGCATNNPRDPLEPMNRAIYGFNDTLDRAIAKPLAEGYRAIVPEFARGVVTNFFSNLDDVWVMVNNLLQGKGRDAVDDFGRVVLNSTVGLLGAFDIATDVGLNKHNEDFGQTLGYWGMYSGPYVVLPIVGPSTLRDASAWLLVDTQGDWLVRRLDNVRLRNSLIGIRFINLRSNLLDASRILQEAALDEYSFVRDAYLQRRENLVHDGNPPRPKESSSALEPTSPEPAAVKTASGSGEPGQAGSESAAVEVMPVSLTPGVTMTEAPAPSDNMAAASETIPQVGQRP